MAFSAAAVSAACASISHRALSAATKLDDILASTAEDGALSKLSEGLRRISASVSGLDEALQGRPTVAVRLQSGLSQVLEQSESAIAFMDKQIQRLESLDPQWTMDSQVIISYSDCIESQVEAFKSLTLVLQADEAGSEELAPSGSDMRHLFGQMEQSISQVMQTTDILRPRSNDLPPSYSFSSTSGPSTTPPVPSQGSKSRNFLSGLSDSLSALAASMKPRPEPFVAPLCHAATRGDQQQIKSLLAQGANINGANEEGKTALICAVAALQLRAVQFLISNGAGVAVKDRKGKPPLFHAAKTGDVNLVSMLLQCGADPNERSNTGEPYWVELALQVDLQIARLLLERGADVNARDITGRSILISAIQAQNVPLVELLVERGADVNARDHSGRTALVLTILADRMDLVKYLLSHGADANSRDSTGQSMLVHAVDKDNIELVKLLLEHGSDPNARDMMGQSVFSKLVRKSQLPTALLFLEHGVDANRPMDYSTGQTVLLYAIEHEYWDLAASILSHGGSANGADRNGKTPLLEAMQKNNRRLVQLLLQHGADVNQEGKITPLGLARASNQRDMLRLLQGDITQLGPEGSNSTAAPPARANLDGPPPDYESID